jgi:DUF1680 family protein
VTCRQPEDKNMLGRKLAMQLLAEPLGMNIVRLRSLSVLFISISVPASSLAAEAVRKPHVKLAVPRLADVRIDDEFWAPRINTCREVTLPHCFDQCEQTGRIRNFVKAAGQMPGEFEGLWFNDSDVYKIVEGAAYSLHVHPDAKLEEYTDGIIAKFAAAQQPDGYLCCYFILGNLEERFKHIHRPARHELYTIGHLIEAGAAHYRMTRKPNLLDVAIKAADQIDAVFGPGKRMDVPEHQELELALIKLYEATGEKRYLDLAKFFIDQRGNADGHTLYGPYSQDHLPVRKQTEIVGHAVRAMYNCIGMVDLYGHSGDEELRIACRRLWESATHRKMYVTGGVGATARGEAFGADYELPNETAYAETCAQIGLVLFAHRMLLIDPDAEYADVMERVLYNSFLSGLSLSGDEFFYQNRLATRGDYHRQSFYGCACCPSNVVRVYPQLGKFIYAHGDSTIYANLYAGGTATIHVKDTEVTLRQETRYPWDGRITLTVTPDQQQMFDICLRIPGWCRDRETPGRLYRATQSDDEKPTLKVNGEVIQSRGLDKGYLRIARDWQPGDRIELNLPMPVRRVHAHPEIKADAGRVALQRGPIVYCVEAVDHAIPVRHLSLPRDAPLTVQHRDNLLGGVTVIAGKASVRMPDSDKPKQVDLLAIPYYAWDNRDAGSLAVWLAEDPLLAPPLPRPTIASRARATASYCFLSDSISAINDQTLPRNSHDLSVPRHTFWDHRGSEEWLQYDFAAPTQVAAVEVYWFDDRHTGGCWVPESWRLLYRHGDQWKLVTGASNYETKVDQFNRVTFDPVETDGLRIELKLQEKRSGGVLEWRVHEPE